jgi:hypothetical protein
MKSKDTQITINADEIVIHLDRSESIAIPRAKLRTRLELLAWIYSLISHPGVKLRHLRALLSAMFRHHGWAIPPDASACPAMSR